MPTDQGALAAFRSVDAIKAIDSLAGGKEAKPDGSPREVFEGLSAIVEPARPLSCGVMESGFSLSRLPRLFSAPLGKPRRTIFLVGASAKVPEPAVHNRMVLTV